jgi:hypothetical protein
MRASWMGSMLAALAIGLVTGLLIAHQTGTAVGAVRDDAAGAGVPRYTIVATAGHTLIVTDNKTNTLNFYTIDKDKEEYTELKLRSTLDLTKVGEPILKPKAPKPE